jgi:hypothetical protein
MNRVRVLLAAALSACLACGLAPATAVAQPFPRLGLYGNVVGGGYPFVKPDFTLDTLEIGRVARFHQVILDVYPISPYRPDIVQALRARNPQIKLLAYLLVNHIWPVEDADSSRHIPTIINHTVRDLNGFLYDLNTGQKYTDSNINLAKRDLAGRYVVAIALANIIRDHIIATGHWDGIFTDVYCHTVGWTQAGTGRVIDHVRAGYPSVAALDAAWAAASDTLAARLRSYAGPNMLLVGNCGGSSEHAYYNGWMRENFPYQQGGTWYTNMLGHVGSRGYLKDDKDYRQPSSNWMLSVAQTGNGIEYNSFNTWRVRYGLASAALGEGYHCFGPGGRSVQQAPYQQWWYDEYAVDIASGQSSASRQHTGWLGNALGPPRVDFWPNPAPNAVVNGGFEAGVVTGWQFASYTPSQGTVTQDLSTKVVGAASARVRVTVPHNVDWYIALTSTGRLSMFAGTSYSATFWAKANPPRRLRVSAGSAERHVDLDGTWRQYQVVLVPFANATAGVSFSFADVAGDVWLDDVHFQTGLTSIWRRDFQNGIVLVNPSERSLDVPLGLQYKRILGTRAPAVNNGAAATTMTVPPGDALFLLRGEVDTTRPGRVTDVRIDP